MLKFRLLYSVVFISFFITACRGPRIVKVDRDLSYIYNPGSSPLHPRYRVFHSASDMSTLYAKIFPNELLFNEANKERELRAEFQIHYRVFDIDEDGVGKEIVDSTTLQYIIKHEDSGKRFFAKIPINVKQGNTYLLRVFTSDLLRNTTTQNFIYVDKTNVYNNQNFMVSFAKNNLRLFEPFVVGNHEFTIDYINNLHDSIFVSYYPTKNYLPKPVFSTSVEPDLFKKPDSIWKYPFSSGMKFQLPYEGLYFFRLDTTVEDGLSVMNFGESFPKLETPKEMLDPLVYITTSNEYKKLVSETNLKLAIDNFWLSKAENLERARELIRIYYNRVFLANYYFTSSVEGWKTDRGMIYIIYGPPNSLEKTSSVEKWMYYKRNKKEEAVFTFNRQYSIYSQDTYKLERSESYNFSWRSAVQTWREGEVFQLDD
jgi:GWxTD domain-containing protein